MPSTSIDVRHFGTDATAIQNAVAAAVTQRVTEVCLEPVRYTISHEIQLPDGIWLRGCGWSTNPDDLRGTVLAVAAGDTGLVPLRVKGSGVRITDLAFDHPQPDPAPGWSPIDYDYCIEVSGPTCFIERVHLYRPARGISVKCGQQFYRGITGQPLVSGIRIEDAQDVVHVDDVHFWPYWQPLDPHVTAWMRGNADAITSLRNDNPQFGRLFLFNYRYALSFGTNRAGHTSKFSVDRLDADMCRTALHVDERDSGTTGDVSVLTAQANGIGGGVGLHLRGKRARIRVALLRTSNHLCNGVRVEGRGNKLVIGHAWIQDWDESRQGFPAIEAAPGNDVWVGSSSWYESASGAPAHAGNVHETGGLTPPGANAPGSPGSP
jgi:hypothetical protein